MKYGRRSSPVYSGSLWIVSRLIKCFSATAVSENEFPLQVVRIFMKEELRRFGGFVKKLEGRNFQGRNPNSEIQEFGLRPETQKISFKAN
jgi:hypothetical protein